MTYLLQQLLENSASRYPEQVAVLHIQAKLTYRQLDLASNRLAHALRASGIHRGDRVGIYLPKSIEAVISIFAILKTGALYVPLDPLAPLSRIAFIISDCDMAGIISTTDKLERLCQDDALDTLPNCVVTLNDEIELPSSASVQTVLAWSQIQTMYSNCRFTTELIEDDLAYIIYTSGSTGTPKGVMISHRASLTFVEWSYSCFKVSASDRVSSHAPFHFDLSIFDIFTSIRAGATIVLVPPALSAFPRNLAKFIDEQAITIWYSVPSILVQLTLRGELEKYQFSALRKVLFAGEVFPIKYLRQLIELLPDRLYYNLYGPTETNVCTYFEVTEDSLNLPSLPIGCACANTEAIVIDDQENIVKPGTVGELCIRGPGLMSGYLGLPEKTQKSLISAVVHSHLGPEKLYKTGDLVKQLPDGNYCYLNRRDNMIKSRGYRIEIGEIETALYSHPHVEEAVVFPVPDDEVGNLIKAVVVLQSSVQTSQVDLMAFCAQKVPKYMVPSLIEFRERLPKTSTGKTDQAQLRQQALQSV